MQQKKQGKGVRFTQRLMQQNQVSLFSLNPDVKNPPKGINQVTLGEEMAAIFCVLDLIRFFFRSRVGPKFAEFWQTLF